MTTPAAVKDAVAAFMYDLPHPDAGTPLCGDGQPCGCRYSSHDMARAFEAGMVEGQQDAQAQVARVMKILDQLREQVPNDDPYSPNHEPAALRDFAARGYRRVNRGGPDGR